MKSLNAIKWMTLSLALALVSVPVHAQSNVPKEASSIVNLGLKDGQAKLQKNGYEIAGSSLFSSKQLWWNEKKKVCVEVKFDGSDEKKVSSVAPGNKQECIKGAAASRKVWASYRDGQAPASTAALEAERSKLSGNGYKVSYWIDDAAPGRDVEFWYNKASNKCMRIMWNSKDYTKMKTLDCKPEQGRNPAPKK